MNSSAAESLFQKLAGFANTYKKAHCYCVQILAKGSFRKPWVGEINGKEYSHTRVFKISGDQFYKLLTGQDEAFFNLYRSLPTAISDFLLERESGTQSKSSVIQEIQKGAAKSERTILDQITFENYSYYLGFDKL